MRRIELKIFLTCCLFAWAALFFAGPANANDYIIITSTVTGIPAGGASTIITAEIRKSDHQVDTGAANVVYFSLGSGAGGDEGGPIIYNFNDANPHVAYKSNFLDSQMPSIPLSGEVPGIEYDKVRMNDDNMLYINSMPAYYSAFQARFSIDENASNINNLKTKFIGKCPQGNYRLMIYAYKYLASSWDPVTMTDYWIDSQKTEISVDMENLGSYSEYLEPMGNYNEVVLLYVMEYMDVGMRVDYVELEVIPTGGVGGEFGTLYDFMDSITHEAFFSNTLSNKVPIINNSNVNMTVPVEDDLSMVDGYQVNTGYTGGKYSGFRTVYNGIAEDPADVKKIKVYFRAATNQVGSLKVNSYALNGSVSDSIGDPIYINSTFEDYEVEITSNIFSYLMEGTIDIFFEADEVNRPIIVDYTGLDVFTESGMIFDFKFGDHHAYRSSRISPTLPPDPSDINTELIMPSETMLIEHDDGSEFYNSPNTGEYAFFLTKFDLNDDLDDLSGVGNVKISIAVKADTSLVDFNVYVWKDYINDWELVGTDMIDVAYQTYGFEFMPGVLDDYLDVDGKLKVLFYNSTSDADMIINYVNVELLMDHGLVTSNAHADLIVTNPVTPINGIATVELQSTSDAGYVSVVAQTDGLATSNEDEIGVNIYESGGSVGITGHLDYMGSQFSGNIYIGAYQNIDQDGIPIGAPDAFTMLPEACNDYSLEPLTADTNYYVFAYMDANSNQYYDSAEPSGYFQMNDDDYTPVYVQGEMSGISIFIYDAQGGRSISGRVYYNTSSTNTLTVLIGASSDPSFADAYIVGGTNTDLMGAAPNLYADYTINGLTDGMYYIGAVVDINGDDTRQMWEPYGVYRCGAGGAGMEGACEVNLYGYDMDQINFVLEDPAVGSAVALRGNVEVSGAPGIPAGGASIELMDSNNSWDPADHTMLLETTSSDTDLGGYNFEITGIFPQSESYAYFIKVSSPGHVVNYPDFNIYFSSNPIHQLLPEDKFILTSTSGTLTLASGAYVDNGLTQSTTTVTITPDGDSINDYAYINFTVNDIPVSADFSGAMARVVIDTNRDSSYDIFDWDQVTWDNMGNP